MCGKEKRIGRGNSGDGTLWKGGKRVKVGGEGKKEGEEEQDKTGKPMEKCCVGVTWSSTHTIQGIGEIWSYTHHSGYWRNIVQYTTFRVLVKHGPVHNIQGIGETWSSIHYLGCRCSVIQYKTNEVKGVVWWSPPPDTHPCHQFQRRYWKP